MTTETETSQTETSQTETSQTETKQAEAAAPAWMQDEEIAGYFRRNGFGEGEEGLVKALKAGVSAEKRLGVPPSRLMTLPEGGLDADPDGWAGVLEKMGVPADADGYAFEPLTLGEGEGAQKIEISDDQKKTLAEGAKALGLTPSQAQGVIAKMYAPLLAQAREAETVEAGKADQRAEAAAEALRKEWGNAFDERLAEADAEIDALAEDFGLGEDFRAQLERTGFQNEAWLVKLLHERAAARAEPSQLPGARGGRGDGAKRTPAEAVADARAFAEKHQKALFDKNHPDHAWAVKERNRLLAESVVKPNSTA